MMTSAICSHRGLTVLYLTRKLYLASKWLVGVQPIVWILDALLSFSFSMDFLAALADLATSAVRMIAAMHSLRLR